MKKVLVMILAAVLIIGIAACTPDNGGQNRPDDENLGFSRASYFITVLTGPTSGIYYPIGGSFFQVANSLGYRSSVTATGASVANINALLNRDGELAISMVDAVVQATESYGAFEGLDPATDLRTIMGLWPNVVQIVTTSQSGITSFEDLRGRRVGVGPPGSGVELNARMMFEAHNMTYDDVFADFLNYGEAIDQIRNGLVDVAFVTSGLGNATIQELGTDFELVFIPIEGAARDLLIERYPFYIEFVIEPEVYGTATPTETVGVMNIMITHADVPDYVIYDLLEHFLSEPGLTTIHGSHANALNHIRLENVLRGVYGISTPMHDGAIQFFENRGIL